MITAGSAFLSWRQRSVGTRFMIAYGLGKGLKESPKIQRFSILAMASHMARYFFGSLGPSQVFVGESVGENEHVPRRARRAQVIGSRCSAARVMRTSVGPGMRAGRVSIGVVVGVGGSLFEGDAVVRPDAAVPEALGFESDEVPWRDALGKKDAAAEDGGVA